MRKNLLTAGMLCLLLAFSACRRGERPLEVIDAWARPGNAGGTSAAYFKVINYAREDETLVSVSTPAAEFAQVHVTNVDPNGVMTMREMETAQIPSGGELHFMPGGLHIMLINLQQDLPAGSTFNLVLNFEKRGEVNLVVEVREP